jgi:SPP1 gp7 family putative phage head morphogenesis protein
MTPPPDTVDKAYQILKASYIDTLTNNAADALIAGEIRASNLLRIPLNFNLINSRAVSATLDYRQTLERFGGSTIQGKFVPWLNDSIQSKREAVGEIVQEAMKTGQLPEKALDAIFTQQEHDAALVAYQETKRLYVKGSMDRYAHEHVQQAEWVHLDPQEDPRPEHQELNGQVFDLDDPIWQELEAYNCHCYARPILPLGGEP